MFLAVLLYGCNKPDIRCINGTINPDNECEECSSVGGFGVPNGSFYFSRDGCCINGEFVPTGTINPENDCEYCPPGSGGLSGPTGTWSPRGCCINEVYYPGGTTNPNDSTEICDPLRNSYTRGCWITGELFNPQKPGEINPDNECQICDPDKDTQDWTTIDPC